MPLRGARENTGALLHKIVHIYAPHANRFLAEGLAVYPHATLVGNPAFPNLGGNLRHLAVRGLSGVEYVKLDLGSSNRLCFRPGGAAFAPAWVPGALPELPRGARRRGGPRLPG